MSMLSNQYASKSETEQIDRNDSISSDASQCERNRNFKNVNKASKTAEMVSWSLMLAPFYLNPFQECLLHTNIYIVSQPSKCLKFMTFREGCFVIGPITVVKFPNVLMTPPPYPSYSTPSPYSLHKTNTCIS